MPEIFRTRDLVIFTKGVTYPVAASTDMIQNGWAGGQGARWIDSAVNEFAVTYSDGVRGAGFALWGSDEDSDKFTAITKHQVAYGFLVIGAGSWLISTKIFEQYTLASRLAPPLVPLTYMVGDKLLWSNRGLWTKEDEWTISGDPRAPNQNFVGHVAQPVINGFLTIQTTL